MSDQEEGKTPWYKRAEVIGMAFVFIIMNLIFLALMGWNEFLNLYLTYLIPYAFLGAVIGYLISRLFGEKFFDMWLLSFAGLMILHEVIAAIGRAN